MTNQFAAELLMMSLPTIKDWVIAVKIQIRPKCPPPPPRHQVNLCSLKVVLKSSFFFRCTWTTWPLTRFMISKFRLEPGHKWWRGSCILDLFQKLKESYFSQVWMNNEWLLNKPSPSKDMSSIVLVFMRKVSRVTCWDLTSLYMQLKNTVREIKVSGRERVWPWYRGERWGKGKTSTKMTKQLFFNYRGVRGKKSGLKFMAYHLWMVLGLLLTL